ncbi:alpha/beta hydrolase [Streptomyces sp. NPDC006333]|uniref:alpha/beta fold hydrolase n=1 Tax=Streptomyces sp. NPDC006333 TaxID=3156753 RepID=UPI0033B1D580
METSDIAPAAPLNDPAPLLPGTHSFRLGGITQRYHVHGNGPVCVAHPGGPGLLWDYLRMPALEEHLTMVYVEPIGSGESGRLPSHPHGYTRDRYSRFLQVLINRLHQPEIHLLGHGHGALVAAHHALHRSERLAGVILYDAEPAFNQTLGLQCGSPTDDGHDNRRRLAVACDEPQAVHISGLDENLSPALNDDHADLESISVPVLVISERNDLDHKSAWGRGAHIGIGGSRLRVLEHRGSLGHLEDPLRFNRAVREFVLETTGRAAPAVGP